MNPDVPRKPPCAKLRRREGAPVHQLCENSQRAEVLRSAEVLVYFLLVIVASLQGKQVCAFHDGAV